MAKKSTIPKAGSTVKSAGLNAALGDAGVCNLIATKRGGKKLQVREQLGLTRTQFARLVPVSERALAEIEKGKKVGESFARPMVQLQRLVASLEEVIAPAAIGDWMTQPNPAFDGLKPMEVIERGEIDRIWQMVYELRSGSPV